MKNNAMTIRPDKKMNFFMFLVFYECEIIGGFKQMTISIPLSINAYLFDNLKELSFKMGFLLILRFIFLN